MEMLHSHYHRNKFHRLLVPLSVIVCCSAACLCAVLICNSFNDKLVVQRNLLYREEQDELLLSTDGKPLTGFKDMYQEDSRTASQRILDNLQSGYVSEFSDTNAAFEIGDLYVWNITPKFSRVFFDLDLPYDVIDFEILFSYDTGESAGAVIHAIPSGYTMRSSVALPKGARKIRVHSFTFKRGTIHTGELVYVNDSKQFSKQSNNTIQFNCTKTRYLVCSDTNVILDDVIISGKGTFVTANGVAKMLEVEVMNDT